MSEGPIESIIWLFERPETPWRIQTPSLDELYKARLMFSLVAPPMRAVLPALTRGPNWHIKNPIDVVRAMQIIRLFKRLRKRRRGRLLKQLRRLLPYVYEYGYSD